MFKNISLKKKILFSAFSITLLSFAIIIIIVESKAKEMVTNEAFQKAEEMAKNTSAKIEHFLDKGIDSARNFAYSFEGLKKQNLTDREVLNAELKQVLYKNSSFLGTWTCWEPNALDGKDSEFINKKGHDKTGRFIPYWYRDGNNIGLEPLLDYEVEGAGDYYLLAKRSGEETILEPYIYPVGGKDTLITSLVVPIQVNSKIIGVAGVDMALDSFQKIVNNVKPYGGYSEIISYTGIYTAGIKKDLIGKKVSDDDLKSAIKKEKIFSRKIYSNELKTDVYEIFVPIYIGESKTPWFFGITLPLENVLKEVKKFQLLIIIISIISILVILLVLYFVVGNIIKPLNTLEIKAKNLATGDGDLTKTLEIEGNDEIAKASKSINEFISKVRVTIENIKKSSTETASIANELSSTAEQIGKRVEEEAKIVEETVKDGEKDKSLLTISLQKSQETKDDIEKSNTNLESAKSEILKMISQIQQSSKVEEELSQKLNQLSSDAEQVKGVLTVIADIADQTNLLALNAAIEAARAGEHGRGFAVVADEVRQLAERTQKSLIEINSTINVIVQAIIDTSEQMNKNANEIQNLANVSDNVENKINETTNLMDKTLYTANESLKNTTEVIEHYQVRIEKIENINELSNSNARSLEETISATEHLHQMTEELNKKINEFKT